MTTDPVIVAVPEIVGNMPQGGRTLGVATGPVKGDPKKGN